jgi:hypothetical protein
VHNLGGSFLLGAIMGFFKFLSAPESSPSPGARNETALTAVRNAAVDTDGARDDMRIANKYIDEWFGLKDKHLSGSLIDQALRYISQARAKDPNATVQIKIDKDVGLLKLDQLEGSATWAQGQLLFLKNREQYDRQSLEILNGVRKRYDQQNWAPVIEKFSRAVFLSPLPSHYLSLFKVHLWNHDRQAAITVLKEAAAKHPGNFDIRRELDGIEADPTMGVRKAEPFVRFNGQVISGLFVLGLWAYVYWTFENFPPAIFIGGGLLIWGLIKK